MNKQYLDWLRIVRREYYFKYPGYWEFIYNTPISFSHYREYFLQGFTPHQALSLYKIWGRLSSLDEYIRLPDGSFILSQSPVSYKMNDRGQLSLL